MAGREFVQEVLAQITWYHNLALLEKVGGEEERTWYARQSIQHGWSRNVLVHQIEGRLYQRQGKALTNFDRTLPEPQSEFARQALKDPYNFDFLTLGPAAKERDLERSLLAHVRDFLLELGAGFALVGSQYVLDVGGEEYRIDLLFYHLRLRCFIVIDLKTKKFQPEFVGKMGFTSRPLTTCCDTPPTRPASGWSSARRRNRSSSSTRCATRPSRSAWPSTG